MLLKQHLIKPLVKELKHERRIKARFVKSKKYKRIRVGAITILYFVDMASGLFTEFLAKFRVRVYAQSKQ